MSYSLTIPVANRPDSLRKVLSGLYLNKQLHLFDLYIGLEPISEECEWICSKIPHGIFNKITIIKNSCRYGVSANPFNLLETTFARGYECDLHIEDDIYPAKDVTRLVTVYNDGPFSRTKRIACFCLFGPDSVKNPEYVGDATIFKRTKNFIPWGLIISRDNWYRHFRENWFYDKRGWDYGVSKYVNENKVRYFNPDKNRTRHLQAGTHVDKKMQRELFEVADFYDGEVLTSYILPNEQSH